ncbi:NADH-dependent flavin oxidoreductase [Priestia megaterium]|nr:NADH-dependent flavin oxidoreductase [Priestia megaterium]
MNSSYEKLFKHFKFIHGMEMKNRLVMGPLLTYASHQNGELSDADIKFYRERMSGVSTVIFGPAYVMENGKIANGQLGIHKDNVIRRLHELNQIARKMKVKTILRLSHGGRLCTDYLADHQEAIGPSQLAHRRKGKKPTEMNDHHISLVSHAFARAAERAIEAGFDGIEIEGGNGHLLQQFTSKQANHRIDRFGGDVKQRLSFSLKVIREVSQVVRNSANKPFLIGYALTPEESGYQGIMMEDAVVWIDMLINENADYIHLEADSLLAKSKRHNEEEVSLVPAILKHVKHRMPIISGGNVCTPAEAEKAIAAGLAMVTIESALIADPKWVEKVRKNDEGSIKREVYEPKRLYIPEKMLMNENEHFLR